MVKNNPVKGFIFFKILLFSSFSSVISASDDVDEEVYELNPFAVVAAGDRYLATNAVSGTRVNAQIRDIPMSLEVITADFISDIGATDLRESLAFSAGVSLGTFSQGGGGFGPGANPVGSRETSPSASGVAGDPTTNAVSIRGFTASFQQRMGFRIGLTVPNYGITLGSSVDAVNIERNEILRGPGALLYGIGVISGIVNVLPKRPHYEPRTVVTAGIGSNDFWRATLDTSIPIPMPERMPGLMSFRFAGAYTEQGDWTDFFLDRREYAALQLLYQPTRRFEAFFEYQRIRNKANGVGQQYLFDDLSRANNRQFRNEFNEQFNWEETYSPGTFRRSNRVTGPDTYFKRNEDTFLANFTWTPIQDLSFNAGVYHAKQETERFAVELRQFNNVDGPIQVQRDFPEGEVFVLQNPPDPRDPLRNTNDYKAVRYWWTKRPQAADSLQWRIEGNYVFQTPMPFGSGEAEHSLLAGIHRIEDTVDFYRGIEPTGAVWNELLARPGVAINDTGDAYFTRNFFDFSPIRYQGEPLARPGDAYFTSDLEYQGIYGVYHGRFFEERLGVILGLRRDTYQSHEVQWLRALHDPDNIQIGTTPRVSAFEKPFSQTTSTYAFNWRISDSLSAYALRASGIAPNTGQQDGNDDFIEPEKTISDEIGIKFDFFDRKFSGTVSVFRIRRENATWRWDNAPAPKLWVGGSSNVTNDNFNPALIESGVHVKVYGVDLSYFDPVNELNWSLDADGNLSRRPPRGAQLPDGVVGIHTNLMPEGLNSTEQTIVYLDYDKLDSSGFRKNIEAAFAEAGFRSQPDDIDPIQYRIFDGWGGRNPSMGRGATVVFEDESVGVDLQLIISPTAQWQIILGYAYVQRETTSGFGLVDAISQQSGISYGTEYDIWVRDIGRENFEDPTRPRTSTGGGIEGVSLFFGPRQMASIWSNYVWQWGSEREFNLGLGGTYQGPAQTSVPVGGAGLQANLYRTPPTPSVAIANAALGYTHRFQRTALRLQLNVSNLLNTHYLERQVSYTNIVTGEPEVRRSQLTIPPRSFRLSMTLSF